MENKKIKLFELFAGIGAPRKALEYMGYEIESLGYSEINKNAIKAYCELFNDTPDNNWGDITKIEQLPNDIDILFHGSPCQDFSVLGQRKGGDKGSGTRSSLMYETVRLIKDAKPKMVIWENVGAILHKRNKHNVIKYLNTLKEYGYHNYIIKANPKHIGFPHSRTRVFTISCLNELNVKDSGLRYNCVIENIVDFNSFEKMGSGQFNYSIKRMLETRPELRQDNHNCFTLCQSKSFNDSVRKKQYQENCSPCIACRTTDLIKMNIQDGTITNASYLKGTEKLALQGFPNIECISDNQKHIVAGNSINIPALIYIYTCFGMEILPNNKMSKLKEVIKGDYYEI